MTEITHDRCSELLGGYRRGELDPDDAAAVERHLAGCEECRTELAGLLALTAGPDLEPLGDDERRRLREAVAREGRLVPATVHEFPAARRTIWERHAGQIVGAAASIVAILFAYVVFGLPASDDAGEGEGAGGGGEDAATLDTEEAPAAGSGPQPVFVLPEVQTEEESGQDQAAEEERSARTLTDFQNKSAFTESSIRRLGEVGPIFREFMEAYTTDDADLAEDFLNQLGSEAPDDSLRDQILECGASLLEDDPERPLLPAFATVADFNDQESLILGFVTTDGTTSELGRFSIFVWPVGDCDAYPANSFGDIRPRP